MDTESCACGRSKAPLLLPDILIPAICSTAVGDLSQHNVSSALMKSAQAAFGFAQTFCKPVPGKLF